MKSTKNIPTELRIKYPDPKMAEKVAKEAKRQHRSVPKQMEVIVSDWLAGRSYIETLTNLETANGQR